MRLGQAYISAGTSAAERDRLKRLITELAEFVHEVNPYVSDLAMAAEMIMNSSEDFQNARIMIDASMRPVYTGATHPRRTLTLTPTLTQHVINAMS